MLGGISETHFATASISFPPLHTQYVKEAQYKLIRVFRSSEVFNHQRLSTIYLEDFMKKTYLAITLPFSTFLLSPAAVGLLRQATNWLKSWLVAR